VPLVVQGGRREPYSHGVGDTGGKFLFYSRHTKCANTFRLPASNAAWAGDYATGERERKRSK